MQCNASVSIKSKSGLLLKCNPHLSVSELDSDSESHKTLYCATITLMGNAVKDIGGQYFIVSKYFCVCFWKCVWAKVLIIPVCVRVLRNSILKSIISVPHVHHMGKWPGFHIMIITGRQQKQSLNMDLFTCIIVHMDLLLGTMLSTKREGVAFPTTPSPRLPSTYICHVTRICVTRDNTPRRRDML